MNAAPVMPPWTWGDSLRLVSWSLLWFALALPVVLFEAFVLSTVVQAPGSTIGDGTWWVDLDSTAGWALFMSAFAAVPVVLGGAVALPFAKVLGSALRRVQYPAVHVGANALLGGALAAVPVALAPELWAVLVPFPVVAASAAALARAGGFWLPARSHPRPYGGPVR